MMYSDGYNPACWYKGVCEDCKGEDNCLRYKEMRFLMSKSNIPVIKRAPIQLKVNSVDKDAYYRLAEIKDNIYNFVYDGKSLYITSSTTGNGKTSWSLKLLMKFFEEVLGESGFEPRGLFIHVPTFLAKLKEFDKYDEEFDMIKKLIPVVDLVVWDDIASTDMSAYDLSQLTVYIDGRTMNEMANIYTGNIVNRDDMVSALGLRLTSRIWNSHTEVIEFFGGDRR